MWTSPSTSRGESWDLSKEPSHLKFRAPFHASGYHLIMDISLHPIVDPTRGHFKVDVREIYSKVVEDLLIQYFFFSKETS